MDYFEQMENEFVSLFELEGTNQYHDSPVHPNIDSATCKSFLKDCGMETLVKKANLLSDRERQCLKSFLSGKFSKETANDLHLSQRTIEFYFENIKNKLTCLNKREVFSVAKEMEDMGIL